MGPAPMNPRTAQIQVSPLDQPKQFNPNPASPLATEEKKKSRAEPSRLTVASFTAEPSHHDESASIDRVATLPPDASSFPPALTELPPSLMASLSHVSIFSAAANLCLPPVSSHRARRVPCCLPTNQQPNEPATDLRVVFAGGGTGGHIYPAIAIADELKNKSPETLILFVGTPKSMESAAVRSAGYNFASIRSPPLARPLFSPKNLFLPLRLVKSLIRSYKILREFEPQIVVGTGGYVSFPLCLAAALKGITLVIQEQNAFPGIANWVLSYFANLVFVAFNSTLNSFPKHKCL
ncbi:hypothetical protein CRG98_031288, partial [Punica granatum]